MTEYKLDANQRGEVWNFIYANITAVSTDYKRAIVDNIIDDVVEDIEFTRDDETGTDFNESDIVLAVGRILSERLGIDG